jgi:putative tryptophan/tyrosine transport system substrate-binding protein
MKRREFIAGLGSAAMCPLPARAQQRTMQVIGLLNPASPDTGREWIAAFRQGLAEAGYVEGRNVAIDYHWARDQYGRLPDMAADLVRRQVAVIVALGIPSIAAAKGATTTIPIVFSGSLDPIAVGFIASLARPGGNITGITTLGVELGPKRLELLHELVPNATSIALLVDPNNPISADAQSRDVLEAARKLGVQPHILDASSEADFESAFANLSRLRAGGLVISNSPIFVSRTDQLGALTLRHAIPSIFQFREFAAAGGLMSYGTDAADSLRLVGSYVGRILKGEKPGDLPVQQATKIESIINLRTAKALGLTIPETLLATANELIQ